jgi:WS/DGAT/MGAT family acyltransferase
MANLASQGLPGPVGAAIRRRVRGTSNEVDVAPALPPTRAPRTPWNHSISPHRRFAFTTLPLDEVKRVKSRFGTTVNDVVMALSAGALRRYLTAHNALPSEALIAMVPVSLRTGGESETYSNRVSGVMANLATNVDDPVERLLTIHGAMKSAKEMHDAMPAEVLQDITQFAPPALAARAMRMASRVRIMDRLNPPFNLIISNVPGPSQPLYAAGARLLHFYPVSAVADGQGLNITVQSYNGNLDFGFIVCRHLVPDVWDMCGYLHEAHEELVKAADG